MLEEKNHFNEVKRYYDKSQKWYSMFYSDRESLGLHYGFWFEDTKSRSESLLNPYREIMRYLEPKAGEKILDAGCGVGGASLWLAANTKASFTGITLSHVQLNLAVRNISRRKLNGRVSFYLRNYLDTGFNDESYDKIFGLESFCYTYPDSRKLYSEMFRILKPGGGSS